MTPDERRRLAEARANALAVDTTAIAAEVLPRTQQALDAVAALASSLAFDLWAAAA